MKVMRFSRTVGEHSYAQGCKYEHHLLAETEKFMGLLESIERPSDLRRLTSSELEVLASEIRHYLVSSVAQTGGHLGPNLGVVELTLAMHRTFRSPRDTFIFDTGHQAYVHKLLTGRQDFSHLRERGGLSGYPCRAESEHDVVENSHASTSLSWADGVSRANQLQGRGKQHVVAVIGDGALTGGMAWEALNNIADSTDKHLVIIVNDNGRSYAPTIGGLAHHLDALRTNPGYERMLGTVKNTLRSQGAAGKAAYDALHGMKRGLKDVLVPSAFFEDLGIKYTGPVDGHDIPALEFALTRAREYTDPVIVHVMTEKGRGYTPAEENVEDRFHAVGKIHPETGLPVVSSRFGWTAVFAEEIVELARQDERIVGVTAAMQAPVGLQPFAEAFPERVLDVGIAEQHALTASAGMAYAGLHPVVALYATFLNRAFDQLLMDVALHRAGVTVVLDRAGVTGVDGASHNGMWDIALLARIPHLQMAAPRDEQTLRRALREAVQVQDAPTVVRYPKGSLPAAMPAVREIAGVDVLSESTAVETSEDARRVLIVGMGAMVPTALEVADQLRADGDVVTVVDPRWILPVSPALVELACEYDLVVTLEDGLADGGAGSLLRDRLEDAVELRGEQRMPRIRRFGIPTEFLDTGTQAEVLQDCAMDVEAVVSALR